MSDLLRLYILDLQRGLTEVLQEYTLVFGSTSAYQYSPLTDALGRLLDCIQALDDAALDRTFARESCQFALNVKHEYQRQLELRVVRLHQQEFYEDVIALLTEWRKNQWIALNDAQEWDLTEQGRRALGSAA